MCAGGFESLKLKTKSTKVKLPKRVSTMAPNHAWFLRPDLICSERSVTTKSSSSFQMFSLASFGVSLFITAIEILWFLQFWDRRANPFMSNRRPQRLLAALSLFWFYFLLEMWMLVILSFCDRLEAFRWSYILFCVEMITDSYELLYTAVSMSRWWLLFFS